MSFVSHLTVNRTFFAALISSGVRRFQLRLLFGVRFVGQGTQLRVGKCTQLLILHVRQSVGLISSNWISFLISFFISSWPQEALAKKSIISCNFINGYFRASLFPAQYKISGVSFPKISGKRISLINSYPKDGYGSWFIGIHVSTILYFRSQASPLSIILLYTFLFIVSVTFSR